MSENGSQRNIRTIERIVNLIDESDEGEFSTLIVRKIIEMVREEGEVSWYDIAEVFELCESCGGVSAGNYSSDTPFIECNSYNCDVAFKQMCDDFLSEVGNGNSTRNLMSQLYDLMKEHKALGDFAKAESDWLKESGESIAGMSQEDLIWSSLNGYGRKRLNASIVAYWIQEREGEKE